MAAGFHADPSGEFGGLGTGQGVLPTGDLAGADLLDGGCDADPVLQPVSDGRPAEVVSGQFEVGADLMDGVIGEHGDEGVGTDLVVVLVLDGPQAEFALQGAERGLYFLDLQVLFHYVLQVPVDAAGA